MLFVTWASTKGGTERHLIDLIPRMDMSQVYAVILCYGQDPFTQTLGHGCNPGVQVVKEPRPKSLFSFWLSFVKYHPTTIIFINGHWGMFPWFAYAAAKLSGAKRVIAILHSGPRGSHTGHVTAPLSMLKRLKTYISRGRIPGLICHRTICVSQAMRDTLVRQCKYPDHKTVTVHNGVDLNYHREIGNQSERIRDELDTRGADPLLVCVARLARTKAIEVLLKALVIICQRQPTCKCLIVGDGPLAAELRALSGELGIASSVVFVGRAEDVRPYLELSDIVVLSSKREGLPLVLLEAMAHGVACVATDVGGTKEVILNGETGFVVEPDSPEALAEAVLRLAAQKEERLRMGRNGRKRVEEFFDIEKTMAELNALLLG